MMTHTEAVAYLDDYHPLQLPQAVTFAEVLTYLGEWADMENVPTAQKIGANEVGPYCTVDLSQIGGAKHRSIAVRASDEVLSRVARRIVTDDDHLSFQIIAHQATGWALVILNHGHIIGSHWLAYIDPSTIPAAGQ